MDNLAVPLNAIIHLLSYALTYTISLLTSIPHSWKAYRF